MQKWTAADGLPGNDIYGLAHSTEGFLWVGTNEGLARFDGTQFKTFIPDTLKGLASNEIGEIAKGSDSQLYLATAKGLAVLNSGKAKTYATMAGGKPDKVQVVLAGRTDEAWFGTQNGSLYHYRKGAVEKIEVLGLSGETVYGLAQTPDGTLWIGTGDGLFLFAHGQINRYRPKIAVPVNGFFDLVVTDAGSVFAATDRGVLEIKADGWRFWDKTDGLPSDHIEVLVAAPGNVVWVGTVSGLGQLAQGQAHQVTAASCAVSAISFDADQSLWLGCEHNGGLLHLYQSAVRLVSAYSESPVLRVTSLVEDKTGAVWMATVRGLLRLKNNQSRLYTTKDGLPTDQIRSVSLAPDDSVWAATDNGFARMRDGRIQAYHTPQFGPDDPVLSILEDHAGTLWVGTPNALYRRASGEIRLSDQPKLKAKVWSLNEDRNGALLVSTGGQGLFHFVSGDQSHFTAACGLASDTVTDAVEDTDGDLWLATSKGISRIRSGKCASVRQINGTEISYVDSLASDAIGHLWLRIGLGVIEIPIKEANHVMDEGGEITHARFYGRDDGFGDELTTVAGLNAVILHSSGEMWFATLRGAGIIDPSAQATTSRPRPVITSVTSDLGEHDQASSIFLEPNDVRMQLAYNTPSMTGAKDLKYRYRLVGFDSGWRFSEKAGEAVYTSLPPGSYKFLLSARRPFEPWIDSSEVLQFSVRPHYYQTWWWYTLIVASVAAAMCFIYQLRVRTIRRQFAIVLAERLRERARLARELHDTLSQGMVGIHLQIEAAQVLLEVDPASVRQHLENVGRLALDASVETRRSIAELRSAESEEPSLSKVLHKAASDFNRSCIIALSSEISEHLPQLDGSVIHEISRILEEALANVRLHSQAEHAFVSAGHSARRFLLEVRDDGRGFKADVSKILPNHFGITGMHERASRINGRLHVFSEPGKGTRVTLAAPLRARWYGFMALDRLSTVPFIKNLFRVYSGELGRKDLSSE